MINTKNAGGPSMEQYVETRLNLLTKSIEKVEEGLLVRIAHLHKLTEQADEAAQRAIDKAEVAQGAHNVASNEWRGTLNDFKATLVSRAEFDRFYAEFSAYRLEASRTSSRTQGERSGHKETNETARGNVALAISVISFIATVVFFFANRS